MYVYFRLFWTIWRARAYVFGWREPIGATDEVRTTLRVYPNDLDFNWHLNNGRYLTLMDIGRMDMTMKTGLLGAMIKHKWLPVLASATIRFRKSLEPFAKFDLVTRIAWWDEKWFYIEQRFEKNGEVYAMALVRGVFRQKRRSLSISEILEALGDTEAQPPPEPEPIALWRRAEQAMADDIKQRLAARPAQPAAKE